MFFLVREEVEEGRLGFNKEFHDKYPDTVWARRDDELLWEQFCFTSHPEDIMPIAIENDIGIGKESSKWAAFNENGDFQYRDANPYRAIAICYLKMQGAK